jgi:soluble lytic murein transglycosylase-like protein
MTLRERIRFAIFYGTLIAAITAALLCCSKARAQTAAQRNLIHTYAMAYDIDEHLMEAIAKVESGFDSNAKGALGEIGLFQLRPEFHPSVVAGDDRSNVAAAALYLAQLRSRCTAEYGAAYWVCYNRGPSNKVKDPTRTKYYQAVKAIYIENLAERNAKQVVPYGR